MASKRRAPVRRKAKARKKREDKGAEFFRHLVDVLGPERCAKQVAVMQAEIKKRRAEGAEEAAVAMESSLSRFLTAVDAIVVLDHPIKPMRKPVAKRKKKRKVRYRL